MRMEEMEEPPMGELQVLNERMIILSSGILFAIDALNDGQSHQRVKMSLHKVLETASNHGRVPGL